MSIDKISSRICERIREYRLGPDHVLSEKVLAQQVGVSRGRVHAALEWMENAGLVDKLSGRGWRVRPIRCEDVEEIFQIKEALDILTVRMAAERVTGVQGKRLMDLLECLELSSMRGDTEDWLRCYTAFHAFILEVAGNERLKKVVNLLNDQWHRLGPAYGAVAGGEQHIVAEHRVIAEAIVTHDADTACKAAAHHAERVHQTVLDVLGAILELVGGNAL